MSSTSTPGSGEVSGVFRNSKFAIIYNIMTQCFMVEQFCNFFFFFWFALIIFLFYWEIPDRAKLVLLQGTPKS